MPERIHEFPVSPRQSAFLQRIAARERDIARVLASATAMTSRGAVVRLTTTDAERIREYLTLCLAKCGFTESYAVNEDGQQLEELIDKLYAASDDGS